MVKLQLLTVRIKQEINVEFIIFVNVLILSKNIKVLLRIDIEITIIVVNIVIIIDYLIKGYVHHAIIIILVLYVQSRVLLASFWVFLHKNLIELGIVLILVVFLFGNIK